MESFSLCQLLCSKSQLEVLSLSMLKLDQRANKYELFKHIVYILWWKITMRNQHLLVATQLVIITLVPKHVFDVVLIGPQ